MTEEGLTRRERMAIPRQDMPERDPSDRATDFGEVNLGFTADLAVLEATRCIECRRPTCVEGCPVGIRIDEFVMAVAASDFAGAAEVIRRDSSLPAICGRVCPQEDQCEGTCVLGRKHRPIAIGHLERFVADWERQQRAALVAPAAPTGRRVAVIGSGPAGLACATDLAKAGHAVTVFEALHEPGGVLVYGIPEFRLPKAIVRAEIEGLAALGVEFVTNVVVGRTVTIDGLFADGYDAVFIGVGAGLPRFLDIPGENLVGVYSANEFLTRVNLMRAADPDAETPVYDLDGHVVMVFGGGNTAMDAVRTALRMGARRAAIVYRRTAAEMPARAEEVAHALAEGVEFVELTAPTSFIGNDAGRLTDVVMQQMELGEPGDDGRRRPVAVEGAVRTEPCDVAIVAIGNAPNPLLTRTAKDLATTSRGTIVADDQTGATSRPGVFAAGDIVTGGATVILAMGGGRRAAAAIDDYLATLPTERPVDRTAD